jgi:hypothetical protein
MVKVELKLSNNLKNIIFSCFNEDDYGWISFFNYLTSYRSIALIINQGQVEIVKNEFLSNIEPHLSYYENIDFIIDKKIKNLVSDTEIIEENFSLNDLNIKIQKEGFY